MFLKASMLVEEKHATHIHTHKLKLYSFFLGADPQPA